MRKALSSILVLILLLGMVLPASAAGTPTLSISSGEVKAGESVTLTVSIENNPGIATAMVYIYFDTGSFSLKKVSAAEDFDESGSILKNSISEAKKANRYEGALNKDGVLVLWYNNLGCDTASEGELLTVELNANSGIPNGDYSVGLGYSLSDTCNQSGEHVNVKTKDGIVSVSGGQGNKTKDKNEVVDFQDIDNHWAEIYIRQSAEIGLVEGYEGLYRPDDTMTRAEFVTILWRSMGEPKPSGKASFTDLTQDWYLDAVAWAEENSVVNGMGDGLFAPTGSVTREQLVTILHRLAGSPMGMELMLSGIYDDQYSDSSQIGDWAKASMYWSIYEGIYCGENAEEIGSTLAPKSPANRAQIAVMMIRYLNEQQ